jgi:membrane protease YdiL (CAAX protease family)
LLGVSGLYLSAELGVLFVGVPVALWLRALPRQPIVVLLLGSSACAAALLRDPSFDQTRLWNAPAAYAHLGGALAAAAVVAAVMAGAVRWWSPERLFDLVRKRPRLWLLVMLLYPVLSVYPQELIYRAFFAHRYAELFPSEGTRIVASAAFFAFGHVFFPRPWVAMGLTFLGGLLFAYHYELSRSLLLASIEHALFGQIAFTVGLGRFFYAGADRMAGGPPAATAAQQRERGEERHARG